jgi:hypothetical protein
MPLPGRMAVLRVLVIFDVLAGAPRYRGAVSTESPDYVSVNRANWDSRAPLHARAYGIDRLLADDKALSQVVTFDLPPGLLT